MKAKTLTYIKKLIDARNSHKAALLGIECIRDLISMDANRAAELPDAEKAVSDRLEHIAGLEKLIAEARASLASL